MTHRYPRMARCPVTGIVRRCKNKEEFYSFHRISIFGVIGMMVMSLVALGVVIYEIITL